MTASRAGALVCAVVGLLAYTASAVVNIETVPVGNPGNAADLRYNLDQRPEGFGRVNYTYNIGKYEVTAGQYCQFLNAVAKSDTYGLYNTSMWSSIYGCKIQRGGSSGSYTYSVASDRANRPVNWISYWDACRFTNWLHNDQPTGAQGAGTTETGAYALNGYNGADGRTIGRNAIWKWAVTSEDEWYKAAYYKGGSTNAGYWDYPTRSDSVPGRDMADVSGNNANIYGYFDPYPIQPPYYSTVGGEFQNSASPYGTFDQGGNVWEWNEAVMEGPYRGVRGGSFYSTYDSLQASFRSYDLYPTVEDSYFGFRVVQVPEPAMLSLLTLAGIELSLRRRRGVN